MFELEGVSQSQWKIGQWVLHNETTVMISTEKDIAQAVGVSVASVSRFWKIVGYNNLKEYKKALKEKQEITPAKKILKTVVDLEYSDVQAHHLNRSIHHLQETLNHFQRESFQEAISIIQNTDRLFIYAPGPSLSLGELLSYRLRRYGIDARLIRWMGSEVLEELVHLEENSAILMFAFSRLLKEGEVLLKHANEIKCKSIIISDQHLLKTPCPYDVLLYAERGKKDEFHSMIAPLFMIENLIVEIGKDENVLDQMELLNRLRKSYKEELPR
ncbi:MurR/RpiR family transcriptional regulator [Bacillus sp. AK128]